MMTRRVEHPLIALDRLQTLLAAFPNLTIGLVGDLFLDRYLDIDPELHELSVETGLEAYQVAQIRNQPGALGTVINNLAALGVGRLVPVSVIGDDGQAYDLLQALAVLPVDSRHVIQAPDRQTPTYTKPMRRDAQGVWRELNRIDLRNRAPLASAVENQLVERISTVLASTDGLIVLDQVNEEGWGVVTPRVREHLAHLAETNTDKLMFVDSRAHIARFRRGILKPNLHECLSAVGRPASDDFELGRAAAQELSRQTGLLLYCTLGERGMLVVHPEGEPDECLPPGCGPRRHRRGLAISTERHRGVALGRCHARRGRRPRQSRGIDHGPTVGHDRYGFSRAGRGSLAGNSRGLGVSANQMKLHFTIKSS